MDNFKAVLSRIKCCPSLLVQNAGMEYLYRHPRWSARVFRRKPGTLKALRKQQTERKLNDHQVVNVRRIQLRSGQPLRWPQPPFVPLTTRSCFMEQSRGPRRPHLP